MGENAQVTNLEQLMDRIADAEGDQGPVSLGAIMDHLGNRSFGPLLLLVGLVIAAPIVGDIPGVPSLMGVVLVLIAVQLLFGRDHFWLPQWLLKRSISRSKVDKAISWMRKPARFIDRFLRPRLTMLVHGAGTYAIAIVCLIIAAALPPMEFVPFSANGAGLALLAFGLGLIAKDGLLALIAFLVTVGTIGGVAYGLL